MFAALSDNLDFFKGKINLCIMLAPVTRISSINNAALLKLKDSKITIDTLEKMGPELF